MVLRSQRPNFPGWHTHLGPKQSRNGISIKKGVVNGKANHFNIFQHPFHTLHFIHLLLPILDSGAFDLPVSHHGGFKIFLSFPTDRRALARNFAHPLDLGTVNSTPKIFSPFLGAPNTAQKVEEMMKLEFSNWFVRTFCAKYNWDSSGTTAIAICKKVCWSNLEYVKTPISKPIWASGMAVAVIAISIPRHYGRSRTWSEGSQLLSRRRLYQEPSRGGRLWIYLPILDLFPKNARLRHHEMMIVTIAFTNLPVFKIRFCHEGSELCKKINQNNNPQKHSGTL